MVDVQAWVAIHQLYGRQSHFIDSGKAREWAGTFTTGGVFDSPSYEQSVVGTNSLIEFAERFYASAAEANEVRRHVISNIDIDVMGHETATVSCYLQIMATPNGGETRIVRFTRVTDAIHYDGAEWLVAHRKISRDDA